jgi:hypothetical protein
MSYIRGLKVCGGKTWDQLCGGGGADPEATYNWLDSKHVCYHVLQMQLYTRWFKYDRDWLCVNKPQFVPVIFEPPCTYKYNFMFLNSPNLNQKV